jgi:glutathione S-transferase/GST-like protein
MIELHYWPTPNGKKITIALEEMGLPYTQVPVNIGAGDQFKPEFLKLSPNGRMPAIVDTDAEGGPLSIFESGAILQYLGRKSGKFYPQEDRARVDVEQWLFWQVGGLGPMAGQANHFRNYAPALAPDARYTAYGANRYTNELHRLFGVIERALEGRDYLAGDYSIADMAAWPWASSNANLGVDRNEFPRVKSWIDRIAARPAVIKGVAVGEELRRFTLADQGPEADRARQILFGQRAHR